MAENATATENPSAPELSEEAKAQIFEALPTEIKEAIIAFNKLADKHNSMQASIKASESQNPTQIKAEIYEQNSGNNKKLEIIRKKELQLLKQIEEFRKEAYEIIDAEGLMPKDLKPEEVQKLKDEVAVSGKELKDQTTALTKLEDMVPAMFKDKITIHLNEVVSRRGTGGSKASANGEGPKRPRFKRIEINDVIEDDKGNKVYGVTDSGEQKFTFGFAAAYLKKQHRAIKWTTKDLQDKYYAGEDENNLPEVKEFVMPYTFKDEAGNDHTVNYKLKCYR